ncbi:response regulator [Mucilaginibacter koreensis]
MSLNYKTCLLIDDNYIDNFVTRRILESSNFAEKIIVEQSAPDAIDSLRDGSICPDVIFLDLRMPMMNGFEFLQEYDKLNLENKNTTKIFMLSSSLDPTDVKRSSQNKYISQFIHKPLTHKILEEL